MRILSWTPPSDIAAANKWLRDAAEAVLTDECGTLNDIRDALSQDPAATGAVLLTDQGSSDCGFTLLHTACEKVPLPPLLLLQEIHSGCPSAADAADAVGRRPLHLLTAVHPNAAAAIGWLAAAQPAAAIAQDSAGRCPLHGFARAYDAAESAACDRSLAGPSCSLRAAPRLD